MTNISSYNFLQQPQVNRLLGNPYSDYGLSQQQETGYEPPGPSQTPYQDQLLQLYGQAPRLDQYQPSRKRNIWAGIASGIAGGFGGAPLGAQVGQQIRYGPYMRQEAEYQSRVQPLEKQAQMEAQMRYQRAMEAMRAAQTHRYGTESQADLANVEARLAAAGKSRWETGPAAHAREMEKTYAGPGSAPRTLGGGMAAFRDPTTHQWSYSQIGPTPLDVAEARNTAADERLTRTLDARHQNLVDAQDRIDKRFNTAQAATESRFTRHEKGLTERSTNKREPKLTQNQIALGRKNVAQMMVQEHPEYAKYFWDDGSGKLKQPADVKSDWESFKSSVSGGRLGKSSDDQEKERQTFLKEYIDRVSKALGTDYEHLLGVEDLGGAGSVGSPEEEDEE